MAPITPDDLGRAVYSFGGYYEKPTDPISEVFLRGSSGPIFPRMSTGEYYKGGSDKDKHFLQAFDPFSFSLVVDVGNKLHTDDVPQYKLRMIPAVADDTHKIVYLPYFDNNITSTTIPPGQDSVRYFMTATLSGCNVYVDERKGGELVCYHANALTTKGDEKKQEVMDDMHTKAKESGDEERVSLRQTRYFTKALELESAKVDGHTGRRFLGATTVLGFRVGEKWEFWFQTYGRLVYTPTGGKELLPKEVPLRIIDYGRVWP